MILKFFKKKEEKEEEVVEEDAEFRKILSGAEEEKEEKFKFTKIKPRIIFIGSNKGGVGKSFLATNLVATASAYTDEAVFAVDLDLDSYTISTSLPPPEAWRSIEEKYAQSKTRYLTVADILYHGSMRFGSETRGFLMFRSKTLTCNGIQLEYSFRLLPAYDYNDLLKNYQKERLKHMSSDLLRKGLDVIVSYFKSRINRGENVLVFFDGKQKSNIGIMYEPLYRLMIDYCDLFILVTDSDYLNFSDITIPYSNVLNKTVIVVNQMKRTRVTSLKPFLIDAGSRKVPVFIVPFLEQLPTAIDKKTYYATTRLDNPPAVFSAALLYLLNIINEDQLEKYGCFDEVMRIVESTEVLNKTGARK